MDNAFLASIDRLIGDEADRLAAHKAENDRLVKIEQEDTERIKVLAPQIVAKLGEVSSIWNGCLTAVQIRSEKLGFLADISGWREDERHTLQVNFHLHAGGNATPLKLTVTQLGMGQFDPNRATNFDFLAADPKMFSEKLLAHVTDLFHEIRDGR